MTHRDMSQSQRSLDSATTDEISGLTFGRQTRAYRTLQSMSVLQLAEEAESRYESLLAAQTASVRDEQPTTIGAALVSRLENEHLGGVRGRAHPHWPTALQLASIADALGLETENNGEARRLYIGAFIAEYNLYADSRRNPYLRELLQTQAPTNPASRVSSVPSPGNTQNQLSEELAATYRTYRDLALAKYDALRNQWPIIVLTELLQTKGTPSYQTKPAESTPKSRGLAYVRIDQPPLIDHDSISHLIEYTTTLAYVPIDGGEIRDLLSYHAKGLPFLMADPTGTRVALFTANGESNTLLDAQSGLTRQLPRFRPRVGWAADGSGIVGLAYDAPLDSPTAFRSLTALIYEFSSGTARPLRFGDEILNSGHDWPENERDLTVQEDKLEGIIRSVHTDRWQPKMYVDGNGLTTHHTFDDSGRLVSERKGIRQQTLDVQWINGSNRILIMRAEREPPSIALYEMELPNGAYELTCRIDYDSDWLPRLGLHMVRVLPDGSILIPIRAKDFRGGQWMLWDRNAKTPIDLGLPRARWVPAAEVSPDGAYLAYVGDEQEVVVCRVAGLAAQARFAVVELGKSIRSLRWSLESDRIAVGMLGGWPQFFPPELRIVEVGRKDAALLPLRPQGIDPCWLA